MSFNITYHTHACIEVEASFGRLMTDPWILDEPVFALTTWKFPPPLPISKEHLDKVDYLYISHGHEDHFHVPSLDLFRRDIHIIIPELTDNPGLRAQAMEIMLRKMGFHHVTKLKPFESIQLDEDNRFTLVPAARSKYWDWENSGFVLELGDFNVLNMNDCPGDELLYQTLQEKFGKIDAAFVQYAGVTMYPGCCRMPEDEMRQIVAERKVGFRHQRVLLDNLPVKYVFPFAGDFAWLREDMLHCNWANRSTPKIFTEFVEENYPDEDIEVVIMQPGDKWKKFEHIKTYQRIDWDNYLELIEKESIKKRNKSRAITQWIKSANQTQLRARTKTFLDKINKWHTKQDLDFTYNVEVIIEGPDADFTFYMHSAPGYFAFRDDKPEVLNHTLIIQQDTWASVLCGHLLLTNIQWASNTIQHTPYTQNTARFWFWFENHTDLNNKTIQVLVDELQYADIRPMVQTDLGVFNEQLVAVEEEGV